MPRVNPCCIQVIWLLVLWSSILPADASRPNVLLIWVDDLRPALGCYGDPLAKTPHMDRLASRGRLFQKAYCNQAVCGPSRASMMTGCLPDHIRVWHNRDRFRDHQPDLLTLPQYFRQHGYRTVSLGKVFSGNARELDPISWSEPEILQEPGWTTYRLKKPGGPIKGKPTEQTQVTDDAYPDGQLAELAIDKLRRLGQETQPFFLAVGFFKPHLPFNAPKKYWDMYESSSFALGENRMAPSEVFPWTYSKQMELGGYQGVPGNEAVSFDQAQQLRHGYYACVSYVDAQIGRVLDALDRLEAGKNTIVLLLGDHGFSLGEAEHWCKKTNFELDTHVPLIGFYPGMRYPGLKTKAMVELVDIYPTLVEWAGLPRPANLEGTSFMQALEEPKAKARAMVLSQHSRPWAKGEPLVMGYSIRTAEHRYTRWVEWRSHKLLAEELYDYNSIESVRTSGGYFIERQNLLQVPSYHETGQQLREAMDLTLSTRVGFLSTNPQP